MNNSNIQQIYDLFEVRKFAIGQMVEINDLAIATGIAGKHGKGRIVGFSDKDRYEIEWKESPMFSVYSNRSLVWEGWLSHSPQ